MIDKEELEEVCKEILLKALEARYEGHKLVDISFYVKKLPHRNPKLVKFALWYLQDKELLKDCEITSKGVDHVLRNFET